MALMFSPLLSFSREGTVKAGDRILSLDGMPLNREKHADALTMLMQSSQEALFLIEYDISVMGERTRPHARPHTRVHARAEYVEARSDGVAPRRNHVAVWLRAAG